MNRNHLSPFLFLLYHCFKAIVWASQRVYYSKVTAVNKEAGRFDSPCIVISNHPSTVLDPLNAVVEIEGEVFFLANASLFKYRFTSWLLNRLYCIPVERDKDTGGRPLNNAASFERSSKHLAMGGRLFIAPEGYSFVYRRLEKIRTGTARIAFAAESRQDFQLGLIILPVGLNYSDPTKFRSRLLTILGEPIRVADFQKDWEANQAEAVRKLTRLIEKKLDELTINTADDVEDRLLRYMEEMAQNENHVAPLAQFERSQSFLKDWRIRQQNHQNEFQNFQEKVFSYFDRLKALKISDKVLSNREGSRKLLLAIYLILCFPLSLVGMLSHFFPVFFTKKISEALNKEIHWKATYKYLAGLIMYPLFIGLQIWGASHLAVLTGAAPWLTWLYVFSIVPSGWAAEKWLHKWKECTELSRLDKLASGSAEVKNRLLAERAEILRLSEQKI